MLEDLTFKSLGIVNYHETLEQMRAHINADDFKNEIWILEHPPIFTLGTAADKKHILESKEIPVVQSDRGGEVTYHGISINFDMDLSPFKQINPCGYKGLEVTQIKDLNKDISKLQLHEIIIDLLRKVF